MLVQEKGTKEKDTRSLRRPHTGRYPVRTQGAPIWRARSAAWKSTGLPRLLRLTLARSGARLTRRAQNTRLGLDQEARENPRSRCGARLAPTGMGAAHLRPSFGGVFKTPYGAPEPRKALGERPQGRRQGCLRLPRRDRMSRRGSAGPKAAEAMGSLRHPGRAFFGFFLCTSKERNPPAVRGTAISY